jgi:ubiquinone/menaquinone biosynthesis C-methylase UbiE
MGNRGRLRPQGGASGLRLSLDSEGRRSLDRDEFFRNDVEFHRKTAGSYDEKVTREFAIYHHTRLDPFLDRVAQRKPGALVLDLGCGTGVVTLAAAARGFRVVGVDHSPEMLEIARRKVHAAGLADRVELEVGEVDHLRFGDDDFDGVLCQGLLHHLPELGSCLDEVDRVLEPGGFLYISEPTRDATPLKRALVRMWRAVPRRRPPTPEDEPVTVEEPISSAELLRHLDRLGFRYGVEYLTHLPRLHRYLPDTIRLVLTNALSRPWRRRQGDLVFVYAWARVPTASPDPAVSGS